MTDPQTTAKGSEEALALSVNGAHKPSHHNIVPAHKKVLFL